MDTMTVSGFRKNMAAAFNKAAEGEDVKVRRGKQIFAIVPIKGDEPAISPELQTRLDKAREEYKKGDYIRVTTHEELHNLLESL